MKVIASDCFYPTIPHEQNVSQCQIISGDQ